MPIKVSFQGRTYTFDLWKPTSVACASPIALQIVSTGLEETRPDQAPNVLFLAASDGTRCVLVERVNLAPFMQKHRNGVLIMENAAHVLAGLAEHAQSFDLYSSVEQGRVWDIGLLSRLHCLGTVGDPRQSTLEEIAATHLGDAASKELRSVRSSDSRLCRHIGRPLMSIPSTILRHAATSALAIWALFPVLTNAISTLLASSTAARGNCGETWLDSCKDLHGPLTHHLQVKAAIVMAGINRAGISVDVGRVGDLRHEIESAETSLQADLRQELKKHLAIFRSSRLNHQHIGATAAHLTAHGHSSTMLPLSGDAEANFTCNIVKALGDSWAARLQTFRTNRSIRDSYLSKMLSPRIHPNFGVLLKTGRTFCRGINLQGIPRSGNSTADTQRALRRCFVPRPDHVFVDVDYCQIELAALSAVWDSQFKIGDSLKTLINKGEDVHRLLAAEILKKLAANVQPHERNSIKPVSFGRPAGMGVSAIQEMARKNYNVSLAEAQIREVIAAYHRLCPELDQWLQDDINPGAMFTKDQGSVPNSGDAPFSATAPFPLQALLRVLKGESPLAHGLRRFAPADAERLWECAQQCQSKLPPDLADQLRERQPSEQLSDAVVELARQQSVFTLSGRLRANAGFAACRNTSFQGAAADGAIESLWRIWRKGYRIVNFVHDQIVVEVPKVKAADAKKEIEHLMIEGMNSIIPGVLIRVKSAVTKSFDPVDF